MGAGARLMGTGAIMMVVIVKKKPGARDTCGCGCSVKVVAVEEGREGGGGGHTGNLL